MGMMISVQIIVNMVPQFVIRSGSNDHLQSTGLLKTLVDGPCPNTEVIGEAIVVAEKSMQRCLARQLVKFVFILSPGYTSLP